MYIKHLYIDSFAALKGKELSLSEGLNVIEGLNESGKSTVCTFIKFMLYGLSGRTSDGEMSERQKYVPWDTGRAAGSLTIVTDGTEYRIDRELTVFDDSQPRERCEVTDLSTGERHFKGEAPGVAILGIPESMFVNSVFVRQIGGGRIDGEGMTAAMENILLSGDEDLSIKKALDRLDKSRKSLMHKRGGGGKLSLAMQEEARLSSKLEEAKSGNIQTIQLENECARLDALIKTREQEKEENTELYEAYLAIEDGRKVRAARKKQEHIRELSESLASLEKYGNVSENSGRISALSARLSAVDSNLKGLKRFLGEAPDKRDAMTEEDARAQAKDTAKAKKAKTAFAALIATACICIALTAALTLAFTPIFGTILDGDALFFAKLGTIGILCILGVIFCILALLNHLKLKGILKKYSAKNIPDLEDIAKDRLSRAKDYDRALTERQHREADIAMAESERESLIASLKEAAGIFIKESIPDADTLTEKALEKAFEIQKKREELSSALGMARGEMLSYSALLGDDNGEAAIRRSDKALATEAGQKASAFAQKDAATVKSKKGFAETTLPHLYSQKNEADTELARLKASTEDSSVLASQLDCTRREISQMRKRLLAIEAAKDALQKAGEGLRSSLMPRIARAASENLSDYTEGKYDAVSLGGDFEVELLLDGRKRDLFYMSAGTADAVYIGLRLALARVLFSKNTPPLVFDESFARIDEERLSKILAMLGGEKDVQSLVFTCRSLEGEVAESIEGARRLSL